MKYNVKSIAVAFGCAAIFAGCCSYTGQVLPGDDMVDEGNQEFARKAKERFDRRKSFKRDVKIVEDEENMTAFLSPNWVPRSSNARANALCQNIEVRRSVAMGARGKLREIVGGIKDFKLQEEKVGDLVEIQAGEASASNVYLMKYGISNIDMQYRSTKAFDPLSGKTRDVNEWVANTTVQIRFLKPDNQTVIATFVATGTTTQSDDGSLEPNVTMLEGAAVSAIEQAMEQYANKFAPPIFVTKTSDDGHFACLNLGSAYGLRPGMAVEFVRHYAKKDLDGKVEDATSCIGTGVIGANGAPVDDDCAWVHVDHSGLKWNPEAPRSVFQWTSVKLIKQTKASNQKLAGFGF